MEEYKFSSYYTDYYKGRAGFVLCGGVSLPAQFMEAGKRLTMVSKPVLFSANEHGAMYMPCDYIVSIDKHGVRKCETIDIPIVTPFVTKALCNQRENPLQDIIIDTKIFGNSGMQAALIANLFGCDPIVICGADCYSGGTYWHDATAVSSGSDAPVAQQVKEWSRLKKWICESKLYAAGGPLLEVFKEVPSVIHI